ncbi:MAG: lysine--tRNA ligase, partial [Verrucomicrobiae bacterium]|nr:lysine--tRNA ligase [Verrucomicrobiae bacterium]
MDDTNQLIEQRKANLKELEALGVKPFANKFTPSVGCADARTRYEGGDYNDETEVMVAGRITAHRDMGKSQFLDLRDGSGRIQIFANAKALGDDLFKVVKCLDLGDFIGVKGLMFKTRMGEISVKAQEITVVSKALRPMPAKWHGLEDTEVRYRQRYLDLIANEDVRDTFLKRSAIIREIRNFLHGRGFVEVETPMMQAIPGGAAATPFVTQHNALGCQFYLRIALELYLKRLLVGGMDKIFEIGRNFRNEGLSRRHNPEFTMLEAYEAYGDYESMMN